MDPDFLNAPFQFKWTPTEDQFEGACAAFWEGHVTLMREATVHWNDASPEASAEKVKEAVRAGMREVFSYLAAQKVIGP